MKLDSRIKSHHDILTCFDIEEAEKFEMRGGYFSDQLSNYSDLARAHYGTLLRVRNNIDYVFEDASDHWKFFLPESKLVIPRKTKWRPYTLAEFEDKFHIGIPIRFRRKGNPETERFLTLCGYIYKQYVCMGSCSYTLDELFEEYEWQSHYTEGYQPFGIEEEE